MGIITFFQINKIKKKFFKKKHHLLTQTPLINSNVKYLKRKGGLKNIFNNNLYNQFNFNPNLIVNKKRVLMYYITLTQKFNNPKSVIYKNVKNINTFSVGSIIKYFKLKHNKCLRRSIKGLNIFINFLKNIFEKKYYLNNQKINYIVFNTSGFDYNILQGRKNLKYFLKKNISENIFYLYNLKISFTKKKHKKIKSIKKRLKKKIILNFLKKTNVNIK